VKVLVPYAKAATPKIMANIQTIYSTQFEADISPYPTVENVVIIKYIDVRY